MKHLQSYALFETRQDLNDLIWSILTGKASFPRLLQEDEVAWAAIVNYLSWDFYKEQGEDREGYTLMPQEQYLAYVEKYHPSDAQLSFDDFIAGILGYTELQDEIREDDPPVEWYMDHFEQPREIAALMKTVADQSLDSLDLNPRWEQVD